MEVKSITPNYTKNSKTSFGMAFRRPDTKDAEAFWDFLTQGAIGPKDARRALSRVIEKHKNDKHFDMYFEAPSTVNLQVKTDEAREMLASGELEAKYKSPNSCVEEFISKFPRTEYLVKLKNAKSIFEKLQLLGKLCFASVKTAVTIKLNPEAALPRQLRDASYSAEIMEKAVNKKIAQGIKEKEHIHKLHDEKMNNLDRMYALFPEELNK